MNYESAHIDDDVREQVELFHTYAKPNMGDALGITLTWLSKTKIQGTMPVNENSMQPMGLLHGGASVALAETLASFGGWLNVDPVGKTAVGVEINANHIRAVRSGMVTGTATPIHRGATTQVWETRITTETDKLVCICRCTLQVIDRR